MITRVWIVFVLVFIFYSWFVYLFADTDSKEGKPSKQVLDGWQIWQDKNCQSCHQLYGLGGYMGPDLTNTSSNPYKGQKYMEIFIKTGSTKMPNFHLNDSETNHLVQFLDWVNKSGSANVSEKAVHWSGTYRIVN